MNENKFNISKRIQAIISMIDGRYECLADVGSDHGQIAFAALQLGLTNEVIATEYNEGPLACLQAEVSKSVYKGEISVVAGDGLQAIPPERCCDLVIVAGMGGSLIAKILSEGTNVLSNVNKLILQPMVASATVRHWLIDNNWCIVNELLVSEDNFLYQIIAAERGRMDIDDDDIWEIGPIIWKKRDALLIKHLDNILQQKKNIYEGLLKAKKPHLLKLNCIHNNIKTLEDKINVCKLHADH